jgi:Zn-dependent M28 family amino/carboxypeptidase
VVLALGVALGCAARDDRVRTPTAAALQEAAARIRAQTLSAYIRFLADDALEGRGPGTRADRLTRLYIQTTMQALGLQPGGPNGTWEQAFTLLGVSSSVPRWWSFARGRDKLHLQERTDFVAMSGVDGLQARLDDAQLVFVGYGIQAPEYQWDDFKGVDLHGKVLLMLNNDPDWDANLFAGKRRLYYGRWTYKYESAARQGAAGAIIIHTPESAGYPWQTVVSSWSGENSRLQDQPGPMLEVQAWVTEDAARRLAALAGRDLDDLVRAARAREFVPVALGVTTSIEFRNQLRQYTTANVMGMLPGRDAALREQVVVYTAHHDHLGMKSSDGGQPVVYNGALDNAAGVAQLLSVAEAYASLPVAPRRSVLFLAVGVEEQGLLGSEYYARHPSVDPSRIAADINFDGGNIFGRTRDVAGIGYGKSTLDSTVRLAAAQQGRAYHDEDFPERGMFYRSDQFSFARIGVPALMVHAGTDYIDRPPGWGRTQVEAWVAQHYHQPSDDFDPSWDLSGMVDDARLAFAVGAAVADANDAPTWNPGDEFEALRQTRINAP